MHSMSMMHCCIYGVGPCALWNVVVKTVVCFCSYSAMLSPREGVSARCAEAETDLVRMPLLVTYDLTLSPQCLHIVDMQPSSYIAVAVLSV